MNSLVVGFDRTPILSELPETFLIVDDGTVIDQLSVRAKRFDVSKHAFNPLKDMTYRKAREFLNVLDAVFPEGESTLTRRYSTFVLLNALLASPTRLEELIPQPHHKDTAALDAYQKIQTLLLSPVLERVLNTTLDYPFEGTILARIDRAEIGDFDAFVLGNLLISQYPGPVVIPDFGFYAHQGHKALIRQKRLIAGLTTFSEAPQLRHQLLMITKKIPSRCSHDDAVQLATYDCPFPPGTDGYDTFIKAAMTIS